MFFEFQKPIILFNHKNEFATLEENIGRWAEKIVRSVEIILTRMVKDSFRCTTNIELDVYDYK